MPSDFFYGKMFLTKTQVLTSPSRNSYGWYPWDGKFQNSEHKVLFLDTNIVTKNAFIYGEFSQPKSQG
jgi:hypothetical protein